MNKIKKILFFMVLVGGLAVRFYKLNSPVADWHSWRQADTAAVARNFLKEGYDLFHPRFDDLSSLPSGKKNPNGYRFVEFPLFNAFHALFYQFLEKFGFLSLLRLNFEMVGRLSSSIFSILAGVFLFLIVYDFYGFFLGFLSLFFYLFLPFNIYYSRTILPDQMMIFLSLISCWLFLKAKSELGKDGFNFKIWLSIIFANLAVLVKPYALFILLPAWMAVFVSKWFKKENKAERGRTLLFFVFYALFSVSLFVGWRLWMRQFPEGIPANSWLLNFSGIRLRPAWWRWLFFERIGKLILGVWGVVFLVLGIIVQTGEKRETVFHWWLLGMLAYLVIFAGGNVTHDYYQVILMPVISIFLAKGLFFLLKFPNRLGSRIWTVFISIFCFLAMIGFSWYQVREFYKINHPEIVEAGRYLDSIAEKDAKVIAPYNGDTALLYQTNRKGWPIKDAPTLYDLLQEGADYYLSVDLSSVDSEVASKCQTLKREANWIVYDLSTCR